MTEKIHLKKITIVTLTFNCVDQIEKYCEAFLELDRTKFEWIVIDGASSDGTAELLSKYSQNFDFFISEPDGGFYFGLNKAISQVKTPYYLVFGADDRPSPSLFEDVIPLIESNPALLLGAVRLMPTKSIKYAGPRIFHHIDFVRAISHHSVGTVIKTELHKSFGYYNTSYSLIADGAFLKRILRSSESVVRSRLVFGDFMLGGMSGRSWERSMCETFLLQTAEGSNILLQLLLLNMRILKRYFIYQFLKK